MAGLKERIVADIKAASTIGLIVQPGSFGSQHGMRCCPMTAVAIAEAGPDAISNKALKFDENLVIPLACLRLDVDEDWVFGFIKGYDTVKEKARIKRASYVAGFNLGREIKKDYGY